MNQLAPPVEASGARPRKFWRRALPVCLLGLVGAGAFWVISVGSSSSANGGLTVADENLHFGEAWQNLGFPWTLQIHNPTRRTVVIEKFATSCPCAVLDQRSLTLEPGETATISLMLDLARYARGSGELRDFSVNVAPVIEGDLNVQPGWTIEGRVRQCVTLSPPSIDFPDALIHGRGFPLRSLKVVCHPKVRDITAVYDRLSLSVDIVREDSEHFRLDVTPQASLPAGFFRSDIKIEALLEDGSRTQAAIAPVKAMVRRSIGFIPDSVLLGARKVGDTVEQFVTLRSLNGQAFVVEGIKNPSSDIKVEPAPPRAPQVSVDFRLHCRIAREGSQSQEVDFIVRFGKDHERTVIPLTVSYHGRTKTAP